MVAILPDNQGSILADIERRLRDLENAPRVGLDRLRSAWGTAAAVPSVFGDEEFGTVGNTWADDLGNTGTGYPTLTLHCPTRVMIIWAARPISISSNAAFHRSGQVTIGVAIDGVTLYSQPASRRAMSNANNATVDVPCSAVTARTLTPGSHTFAMWANWTDTAPAAPTLPRLTDCFLSVLPLTTA